MRVTFLGTGTSHGVPMIGCDCATCRSDDPRDRRLRPSLLIEAEGVRLLVDAGPDLREQALRHRIASVDAILFTHGHADHILGMDDVRAFNARLRGAMPCYGDAATLRDIRQTFWYVFDPRTPKGGGLPRLELFEVLGDFCVGRAVVEPIPLWHGRRSILGFRLGAFAYLTDCSAIPESSEPRLSGLDVVVLDALRDRPHPTHFTLEQAVAAARRIGARRTWFTHMCHDLPHQPTCERLGDGMSLAYDGMTIEC